MSEEYTTDAAYMARWIVNTVRADAAETFLRIDWKILECLLELLRREVGASKHPGRWLHFFVAILVGGWSH
jgi:hypothetical protein